MTQSPQAELLGLLLAGPRGGPEPGSACLTEEPVEGRVQEAIEKMAHRAGDSGLALAHWG